MKTREEILKEYALRVRTNNATWREVRKHNRAWREAALAELDDPLARLIAAAKEWQESHRCHFVTNRSCKGCDDFQSAIGYAEQRRVQG